MLPVTPSLPGIFRVEVTRSVLYDRSGKPVFTMRYMTLWQKSGGDWRIHRDVAIPVGPAQQP